MSASLRSLSLRAMRPASKLSTVSFAPSSALLRAAPLSTQTVQRPTSPHVTIYRWPVPAISSIMNRVTGVGMGVGVIGMSFVALGGGCDIPAYVEVVKTSIPMAMPAIKMVISFPIVYHYAAGVRHIVSGRRRKGDAMDG